MWIRPNCLLAVICVSILLLSAAVHGGKEDADVEANSLVYQQWRGRSILTSHVDYDGDYSSQSNKDPGLQGKKRRSLLQDYTPSANKSPSTKGRKLLQDYSPTSNQRSPYVHGRRLFQDYSPMANQRSPSHHK